MAKFSPRALAFGELAIESFRLNNRLLAAGDALSGDLGMSSARWHPSWWGDWFRQRC